MANDYNILAKHIAEKYMDRISGRDIEEYLIGEEPAKRVMVGMLAENRVDSAENGDYKENPETRFESVPSISVTFLVKKSSKGSIHIIPQGFLFYMVPPDYDRTVSYLLQLYSERDRKAYASVNELCEKYPDQKFFMPRTYKKIDIARYMGDGIEIPMAEIKTCRRSFETEISERLSVLTEQIAGN